MKRQLLDQSGTQQEQRTRTKHHWKFPRTRGKDQTVEFDKSWKQGDKRQGREGRARGSSPRRRPQERSEDDLKGEYRGDSRAPEAPGPAAVPRSAGCLEKHPGQRGRDSSNARVIDERGRAAITGPGARSSSTPQEPRTPGRGLSAAPIFEEKVIDFIVEMAKVRGKPVTTRSCEKQRQRTRSQRNSRLCEPRQPLRPPRGL